MKNHPLLKFSDFRSLFISRLITATGDKFFAIALSWWIVSQSFKNGDVILGTIMGSSFLGVVIFGPFSGTLSDRFNKKKCMSVAMILSGILITIMILVFPIFYIYPLLLCVFYMLVSSLEPLFTASADSSITYLVDEEDLPKAIALSDGILSFSGALGAMFAGTFITLMGTNPVFIINALSFFVAFLFILKIKTKIPIETQKDSTTYLTQLKEGFLYIKNEKAILSLIILFGSINLFLASIGMNIVLLINDVYKGTALNVSIMEASMAMGAIMVSLILGSIRIKYNKYLAIWLGILLPGIAFIAIASLNILILCYLSIIFVGIGLGIVNISAFTIFQTYVPSNIKGRFFSIVTTICFAVVPVGNMISGLLSEHLGVKVVILYQGICIVLMSIGIYFIPKVKIEGECI